MIEAIEYEDLSEKVYKALKTMILSGELPPGEKIRQEEVSSLLGTSRTPLVAAFSRLAQEMLVELLPRRGARVRKLDGRELLDIYDLRLRLEPLGAAEAAARGDPEGLAAIHETLTRYRQAVAAEEAAAIRAADYAFHLAVMRASGNEALYRIVSSFNLVFIANQRGLLKAPAKSLAEHEALEAAIEAGDGSKAETLMEAHLSEARERLRQLVEAES